MPPYLEGLMSVFYGHDTGVVRYNTFSFEVSWFQIVRVLYRTTP